MDKFVIEGGKRLHGRVKISGAKNHSLAMMPATLLAPGTYHFSNTPNLRDVWTMSRLLGSMGLFCELNGNDLFIDSTNVTSFEAPYEHVKKCERRSMLWVHYWDALAKLKSHCPADVPGDRGPWIYI
jgi:UDP-N-acetylglucosamine 1-carboxyvinyltransferase